MLGDNRCGPVSTSGGKEMPRGANREDPWELLDASLTVCEDRLRWKRRRQGKGAAWGYEEVARPRLVNQRALLHTP